jgi:Protein of unknown function (DUF1573)
MNSKSFLVSIITALALAPSGFATFHLIQVEQVIASLDGNTSAQAIQLRMRAPGQFDMSQTRLRVWNSSGTQPVVVLDIDGDVTRDATGSRILLATQTFTDIVRLTSPTFTPDFMIINPIPEGNFVAGRLTLETDQGFILWSLAWGNGLYTGSNAGAFDNDANGNYGPPFPTSLPATGRRGVIFTGPATALSTTNAADYALSADPATVITNNGRRFIIGPSPEISVQQPAGTNLLDGVSRRKFGTAAVGSRGVTKTFTIRNLGNRRLTRLDITRTGAHRRDFIVSELPATSILPGDSVKFKVTFKPRATGTRKAAIHIRSNDSDENPFDIKLKGTGRAP